MTIRIRHIILLGIFVCDFSARAAELPPFNLDMIRKDHPRMFFNAETWPQMVEKANGYGRKALQELLDKVDKLPDAPVVKGLDQLVRKETAAGVSTQDTPVEYVKTFGREAADCALAWRFTREAKYLEKAKTMLKVSIDAYTKATANKLPIDWYSFSRINALCAYDWIFEALTDEERRSIIVPLTEHVKLVQHGAGIPRQQDSGTDTGYYCMNNLLWYSGLATYGDGYCDELAVSHLMRGYAQNVEMCNYREKTAGDDGELACASVNYAFHVYPYAHFNFFYTMESATGVFLADYYPVMPLVSQWVWWQWIRDEEYPKACRTTGVGDLEHDQNTYYAINFYENLTNYLGVFGKTMSPELMEFTAALREFSPKKTLGRDFPIYCFLPDPYIPISEETRNNIENCPLKCRHFENIGQFYMRTSWTPESTYCTFSAGATITQHKHYDENNFAIFKHDHLALDTGDRGWSTDLNLCYYYCQSVAHNVVLIQKPDEPLPKYWGPKTEDPTANLNYGGMVNMEPADVLAFETNDDFTYIASDATRCYGDKCTEAVRQFVFVYPDYFIVYDRVGASDPSFSKAWLLHTQNEPRIKDGILRADATTGRLFCQTFLPEDAKYELIGGKGREFWVRDRNFEIDPKLWKMREDWANKIGRGHYMGGWRLELKPGKARKDDRFLNVLTATSIDYPKPVPAKYFFADGKDCVELTIKGRKMTFRFNREGKVGGEMTVGKKTMTLTDSVEKQSGLIFNVSSMKFN